MTIQINYPDNGIGIEIIASGIVTGEEIIKAQEEFIMKRTYKNKNTR